MKLRGLAYRLEEAIDRQTEMEITGMSSSRRNKALVSVACFPIWRNDDRYPCPGPPAKADILEAVGALLVYAIDSLLISRSRHWNYRWLSLCGANDGVDPISPHLFCPCEITPVRSEPDGEDSHKKEFAALVDRPGTPTPARIVRRLISRRSNRLVHLPCEHVRSERGRCALQSPPGLFQIG